MRMNIIVNFKFEGIHQWSGVMKDGDEKIKNVEFLKHPHRHIFHVTAKKEVKHDDRDIEIIQLKRQMERMFSAHKIPALLGETSCEQLAKTFIKTFDLCYCSVLEDGENGAEAWADTPVNEDLSIDELFKNS